VTLTDGRELRPRATPEIRPRRVRFDWEDAPLAWLPSEPGVAHVINVLHLLLPAGERWFVRLYKDVLPRLESDPELHAAVKGFMGQEAVHARAHAAVLDHFRAHGIDPDPYVRQIDWMFEHLLGDDAMPPFLARRWFAERCAIVAAIEHFTAVLGDWIVQADRLEAAGADPTMLDLLRWHGAEEVEHRAVAFDVFQAVSGRYLTRVRTMLVAATMMIFLFWRGARYLAEQDPTYSGPVPTMRRYRKAARRGLVPRQRDLLLAIPRYCRKGFHPSQESDTAMALAYLARSPAARAAT
jgi:predicted metal-dependent hydrolase